jgi:hypothetical protein
VEVRSKRLTGEGPRGIDLGDGILKQSLFGSNTSSDVNAALQIEMDPEAWLVFWDDLLIQDSDQCW